jgi:hypothetical protein
MKKTALLFSLFLLLSSCSTTNKIGSDENALNGKWNWVSSSGGFIGKTITPASENKKTIIEISNSTIKKYENGNLIFESKYAIKEEPSIYGNERKMILFENDMPKQSFEIKDNKLYLSEECNDCYQSEYIRLK